MAGQQSKKRYEGYLNYVEASEDIETSFSQFMGWKGNTRRRRSRPFHITNVDIRPVHFDTKPEMFIVHYTAEVPFILNLAYYDIFRYQALKAGEKPLFKTGDVIDEDTWSRGELSVSEKHVSEWIADKYQVKPEPIYDDEVPF